MAWLKPFPLNCCVAAIVLLRVLSAVMPTDGQIVNIDTGAVQVAVVGPRTGVQALEYAAAIDGLRVAEELINGKNDGRGVLMLDRQGTRLFFRMNVTALDSASDATLHTSLLRQALNRSLGAFSKPPPYNPLFIDAVTKHTEFTALLGMHPAYSKTEAVAASAVGLLHLQCCTPSGLPYTASYGQDRTFVYGLQRSASVFATQFVAAIARRGVRSVGLVFSHADPSTEEACYDVQAAALANDVRVAFTQSYDLGPLTEDAPYTWGKGSGLSRPRDANDPIVASAASSVSSSLLGVAAPSQTTQLETLADTLASTLLSHGITTLLHCGLYRDTAAILTALLVRRRVPLEGLFSYPGPTLRTNASSDAAQFSDQLALRGLSPLLSNTTLAAADSRLLSGMNTPSQLLQEVAVPSARYVTTGAPWLSDARYNDSMLLDVPTFVAAFRTRFRYEPPWQAAAAAASLSILAAALQPIFAACEVAYPRIVVMLTDPAAAPCTSGEASAYMRWVRRVEATRFDTVFGPVAWDASHINAAQVPLLVQVQSWRQRPAYDPTTPLSLVIVAPVAQARYVSGQSPVMPTKEAVLADPPPHALVFPMPGATYITLSSPLGVAALGVSIVSVCLLLCLTSLTFQHRYKTAVRKSKFGFLLCILLFGLLLTSWPVSFLGSASEAQCNTRVALPPFALSLVLAPIAGKAFHARKQFDSVIAMGAWKFRAKHVWLWLLPSLAVDAAIVAYWLKLGGLGVFRAVCVAESEKAMQLFQVGMLLWKLTQAVIVSVLVSRLRFLTLPFDEGHYLAIATYHFLAVLLLALGAYLLLLLGPWQQVHEWLAAANFAYAFPRSVAAAGTGATISTPEDASLAACIAVIVFSAYLAWFTVPLLLHRPLKEALSERNTIAEAAMLRKRAKRQAAAQLSSALAAVAPDGSTGGPLLLTLEGPKSPSYHQARGPQIPRLGDSAPREVPRRSMLSPLVARAMIAMSGGYARWGQTAHEHEAADGRSGPATAASVVSEGSSGVSADPHAPVSLSPKAAPTPHAPSPNLTRSVRRLPTMHRNAAPGRKATNSDNAGGAGGAHGAALVGGAGFRVKAAEDTARAAQEEMRQLRDTVTLLRSQLELLRSEAMRAAADAARNIAPAPPLSGADAQTGKGISSLPSGAGPPATPSNRSTSPAAASARRASLVLASLALATARRASVVRSMELPAGYGDAMRGKAVRRASQEMSAAAAKAVRSAAEAHDADPLLSPSNPQLLLPAPERADTEPATSAAASESAVERATHPERAHGEARSAAFDACGVDSRASTPDMAGDEAHSAVPAEGAQAHTFDSAALPSGDMAIADASAHGGEANIARSIPSTVDSAFGDTAATTRPLDGHGDGRRDRAAAAATPVLAWQAANDGSAPQFRPRTTPAPPRSSEGLAARMYYDAHLTQGIASGTLDVPKRRPASSLGMLVGAGAAGISINRAARALAPAGPRTDAAADSDSGLPHGASSMSRGFRTHGAEFSPTTLRLMQTPSRAAVRTPPRDPTQVPGARSVSKPVASDAVESQLSPRAQHDTTLGVFLRSRSAFSSAPIGASDEEIRGAVASGVALPVGFTLEGLGLTSTDAAAIEHSPLSVVRRYRGGDGSTDTAIIRGRGATSKSISSIDGVGLPGAISHASRSPGSGIGKRRTTSPGGNIASTAVAEAVSPVHVLAGPSVAAAMDGAAQNLIAATRTPLALAVAAAASASQASSRAALMQTVLAERPSGASRPSPAPKGTRGSLARPAETGDDSLLARPATLAAAARPVSLAALAASKTLMEADVALQMRDRFRDVSRPPPEDTP